MKVYAIEFLTQKGESYEWRRWHSVWTGRRCVVKGYVPMAKWFFTPASAATYAEKYLPRMKVEVVAFELTEIGQCPGSK